MDVEVPVAGAALPGDLSAPDHPHGMVIFAHGSGSSRNSPRNKQIADDLNRAGFATLLFDLLTPEEGEDRSFVFDVPFLSKRLVLATRWIWSRPKVGYLPIGYFGASTGAGAAIWGAATIGPGVAAIVCRGGRPDLASTHVSSVTAPTLLIVGSRDEEVLELNRAAEKRMTCVHDLAIVQGATHLFEEEGAIEELSRLATDWFTRYLAGGGAEGVSA